MTRRVCASVCVFTSLGSALARPSQCCLSAARFLSHHPHPVSLPSVSNGGGENKDGGAVGDFAADDGPGATGEKKKNTHKHSLLSDITRRGRSSGSKEKDVNTDQAGGGRGSFSFRH